MIKSTVGIVTITRNNEQEVINVFSELKKQSYKDFIFYVIDDYSDGLPLLKSIDDPRFKLLKYPGKHEFSYGNKFNYAFKCAIEDGLEFIFKVHTDMSFPNILLVEALKKAMIKNEKVVMVGPTIFNGEGKKTWGPGIVKRRCGHEICITESYMIRASYLTEQNGFEDENFTWFMEEADLFLRVIYGGNEVKQVEEELIHFGGATSSKFSKIKKFHRSRSSILFLYKHNSKQRLYRNIRWLWFELKGDINEGLNYIVKRNLALAMQLYYNMLLGTLSAITTILTKRIQRIK